MLRPPVTIPVAAVHGLLSGVQVQDVASLAWTEELLQKAGIAPALLEEASSCVTAEQYTTLFRLLMDRLDDECLGLLSRPLRRGSFALLARSAVGAPSLEVALQRVARSFRLLQDDVALVCLREGSLTGLCLKFNAVSAWRHNFAHELMLRVFWRLLAWLHGGDLRPRRFDFSFEQPHYAGLYAKIFPGAIQFSQPYSGVWFDAVALAKPVRRDQQALKVFLQAAPGNVVGPWQSEHTVSARVRDLLQQTSPAWPDLAVTAKALHLSTSTLQRHLAMEGTTFQSLKDQLRRDMAITRLNSSTRPLAALAAELGFADSAAFQRAFKGWTGSAPGSYRKLRKPNDDQRCITK